MEKITLISQSGSEVQIKLNSIKKPFQVEELLDSHNSVYWDKKYNLRLETEKEIQNLSVYINQEKVKTNLLDNVVHFRDEDQLPFLGTVGLAQITLCVNYSDGDKEWLYSEYLSVLIKGTDTNTALNQMLRYVYENQNDILRRDAYVTGIGKKMEQTYDDFWSQVVLLEEIANVYENSYGYFMANCRSKLEKVDVLDRTEKLQDVSSKTIQYIAQHPEYLSNSITGIRYGRQRFMPSKTLMPQKRITNDIYENQVVLSFLEYILKELTVLSEKIDKYDQLIRVEKETEGGYVASLYLLHANAKEILREFSTRLAVLEKQFHQLVISYSTILKVKRIPLTRRPDASPIFLNVPQYNRIYLCILRWFSKSGYELVKEKAMLSFISASSIYEMYVLIKLINQIKDRGYELVEAKNVVYPKQSSGYYKNSHYHNTFAFQAEHAKITLYYEPVIYDEDRSNVNDISLYRNTLVSLNKETVEECQGRFYTPDFIIRYEEKDRVQYLICDAKFSRRDKVKYQLMPELIYKYITSLSPINENAEVSGLIVFYGLSEDHMLMESFYDRQLPGTKKIIPYLEMMPLSENISYKDQEKNASEMFNRVVNRIM